MGNGVPNIVGHLKLIIILNSELLKFILEKCDRKQYRIFLGNFLKQLVLVKSVRIIS